MLPEGMVTDLLSLAYSEINNKQRIINMNKQLLMVDAGLAENVDIENEIIANDIMSDSKSLSTSSFYRVVKRALDVVLSAFAILVLSPLMLLICLLIRIDSKGPAVFIHNRVGKDRRPLPLYKFRSMCVGAESMIKDFTPQQKEEWEKNCKLDNDPRITRVGRILRKTSLDELPQLFNILFGDLSIVGPRPVVTEELERYGENSDKFLSVTPGLTGYWQAYARNDCTYEKRMKMELYYVDNANLLWDTRIIFATFGAVLTGRGAK